jgi:hypothetical protein
MHVDEVVEGVYQRLCIRYQDTPAEDDRSMSLSELRLRSGRNGSSAERGPVATHLPGRQADHVSDSGARGTGSRLAGAV